MALMTRMTRLLRADLHALLDAVEDPAALLSQSIREMEEALAESERTLAADTLSRDALARRRDELAALLAPLAGEVELALSADQEPLARVLLRRRLEAERTLARLVQRITLLDSGIETARRMVGERRQRLDTLRRELDLHRPPERSAAEHETLPVDDITDADVELALLRARRSRS
jgi:phage shock protein A